ncbi:MAG TPA: helix-turn-helix domain-containing protein [Desulfobacterales bacterium]|nr:helix-turn-helix domain-containing protein [Desulfobacterales bacterium]
MPRSSGTKKGVFSGAELPLDPVEKATILNTLATAGNSKSEAARRLGSAAKTRRKKRKHHGVMP